MASDRLRIGIIGAGSIVRQRHMPGLAKIDGAEVAVVCNKHYHSAEVFAQEYGVPEVAHHWREVIGRDDLDIIWIGTTPYMHKELTIAALEAGKHVFCQARMCMNLDEARQIVAAQEAHPDKVVRFCPPPMGMAGDRTVQRLLNEERFCGDIRHVTLTSVSGALLDPSVPLTWRLDKEQSGQNVLTLGIYLEVIGRWLGPTRRVTAVTRTWTDQRVHPVTNEPTPVEIPELVDVIVEYENGGVGLYMLNGVSSHAPSDHLAVHGTEGTIVYDFNVDETRERIEGARREDESMQPIEISDDERRPWTVEEDFIQMVHMGKVDSILPDVYDGMRYMSIVDAVYRSASMGRTVDVATG